MRSARKKFETRRNRIRSRISKVSDRIRLSVFKSGRHVYAQIIDDKLSQTLISASTLDTEIRMINKSNCNINTATKVGELIGKKAANIGITKVVFDKGGYKYHGVVKALAEAARSELEF